MGQKLSNPRADGNRTAWKCGSVGAGFDFRFHSFKFSYWLLFTRGRKSAPCLRMLKRLSVRKNSED